VGDLPVEYQKLAAARRGTAARLERSRQVVWWGRLLASAGLAVALALVSDGKAHPAWLAAPVGGLLLSLWAEGALGQRRDRALRAAAFHEAGLARLDGAWGRPDFTGEEFASPSHPYALDLDVVGERSLFTRISLARTRPGAATLAGWLLAPAAPGVIRARQEAVAELRHRLDLREALALAGRPGASQVDVEELVAWGNGPPLLPWPWLRLPLTLLAGAVVATAVGALALGWGIAPLAVALACAALAHLALRRRIALVTAGVLKPSQQLSTLAEVMALLEGGTFTAPELQRLQRLLLEGGRASRRIARLDGLVERLLSMRMELVAAVGYALLWPARHGLALEAWRAGCGKRLWSWLAAAGELEALCSLASHAAEHPADPFPELVKEGPLLDAEGLGHPLLPEGRCVLNDVRLDRGGTALLLLSGSNMSGKSTLIRAVGTNAVLALAGAPVRARRLRLSPLAIGASVRVHDSVLDGESRFFAEILRLRDVVRLTEGGPPVLFLLDEILQGTNSHDRLAGAEAVLTALVGRGAIGLCSTHDLALARIADGLAGRAANAHFGDALADGKLHFDYKLRSGVVQHSNALELMRMVGLPG